MVVLVIAVSDAEALSGMILAAQPRQPVRPPAISCFSLIIISPFPYVKKVESNIFGQL